MDDQVSNVPSQVPPRATIEFPSLASVGAALMLGIHPTLSGASLANGLAAEKEPYKAGKHPLQNHVPTSPSVPTNLKSQTSTSVNFNTASLRGLPECGMACIEDRRSLGGTMTLAGRRNGTHWRNLNVTQQP